MVPVDFPRPSIQVARPIFSFHNVFCTQKNKVSIIPWPTARRVISIGAPTICRTCFDEIGLTDRTSVCLVKSLNKAEFLLAAV